MLILITYLIELIDKKKRTIILFELNNCHSNQNAEEIVIRFH